MANSADQSTPRPQARRGPRVLNLPWWFWLGYADVKFWFLTVPAAIGLLLAARHGAEWLGAMRWLLFGAAALLALPFPAAAAIFAYQKIDATNYWRVLDRDETVAGLKLPVGSRLHYADKARTHVTSIDLPHATDIAGMRLIGTIRRFDPNWNCVLAEDQILDGFPCRHGIAVFNQDGILKFMLAAGHELAGLQLPRGTMVERGSPDRPWTFLLPPDAGVHLPSLATTAPGGVTLTVANDGALLEIGSGHGQTIIVRGLPLNSKNFRLQDAQVISELTEPFFVADAMRPIGAAVRIDLPTGNVSVPGE